MKALISLGMAVLSSLGAVAANCSLHSNAMQFYDDNPTYFVAHSPVGEWLIDTPAAVALDAGLLQAASEALRKTESALSFLVLRHGRLVWEQYFKGSKSNHSNNVHSISKSILSALVGIAVDNGHLQLDQTLSELLPQYDLKDKTGIRIKHLLNMTAGFQWEEDHSEYEIEDHSHWLKAILDLPMIHTPGNTFTYSTGSSHLLSAALTERTGMSTCAYAKKYLLDPMNITPSHWGKDPQHYYFGGCNLYLTPRDVAKIAQLYLQRGVWKGERLLSTQWIRDAWKPQATVDGEYQYGYLWWLKEIKDYSVKIMWGYGGQFAYVIPKEHLAVIITADTKQEFPEIDGDSILSDYVLPALNRGNAVPPTSGR